MAKHLWRRGNTGWTFQIAVPKSFINRLGATPFRISLGALSVSEAKRRARVLAGYATATMGRHEVSREMVSRGLVEIAAQIKRLDRQAFSARLITAHNSSAIFAEMDNNDGYDRELVHIYDQRRKVSQDRLDAIKSMREGLDAIGCEIVRDGEDWDSERRTYERVVERLSQQKPVNTKLPLLSVAAEEVITARAKALGEESKDYIAKIRRSIRTFVGFIGDKKVSEYSPLDLQTFATALGKIPKTWSSDKRLRDLSPPEIIKRAATIRDLSPMSKTTVAEYVSQFRGVWQVIRATYPHDVLALGHEDLRISLPRGAARPVERSGLSVEKINKFFALAARRKRPDDRFLPLLGALTGARLGELVYLQVADIQRFGDHWTLSLIADLEDDDGAIIARQLKTLQSRRIIALPDTISQTGFLDWVRGLKSGFLWPQLFRTERPHATASKRMIRMMKITKIHVPLEQTFHSLRHGYKDYLREMKVADRTADIQVGHALDSVAKKYGSKTLRPDEIVTLATLPLPEGLDIAPYHPRSRR